LEQAALRAVPALNPYRLPALFHAVDRGRAKLRTESREGPAARVEHSHTALPVHHDRQVPQAGVAGRGDIQDVLGLL
jgi:hypothetical protein